MAAAGLPVAAIGEEAVGFAGGAEVEPLDVVAARFAKRALGARPEVELAPRDDVGAEAGAERVGDVFSDLVAAGPDRRADDRCRPAAERRHPRLDDAGEQAAPADVENGDRRPLAVRARDCD